MTRKSLVVNVYSIFLSVLLEILHEPDRYYQVMTPLDKVIYLILHSR